MDYEKPEQTKPSWFQRLTGFSPKAQMEPAEMESGADDGAGFASDAGEDQDISEVPNLFTQRPVQIGAITYQVPAAVIVTDHGWRARWKAPGYPIQYWRFEAQGLTRAETLEQAKRWLAMERDREFVVERTVSSTSTGSTAFAPRFQILIEMPQDRNRKSWSRLQVGSMWYMNQQKIDDAIARMHLRLDYYEHRRKTMSHEDAVRFTAKEAEEAEIPRQRHRPMRLTIQDLFAWNGNAQGIRFEPAETIEHRRKRLYWPELQGFVEANCPGIRVFS